MCLKCLFYICTKKFPTKFGFSHNGSTDIKNLSVNGFYQTLEHLIISRPIFSAVESSWNAMVHRDAREGKWRGNWRMEWLVSTLHITSEHGLSSITTADAHTTAASNRLNWRPCRSNWTRPFRRKTKSGFCACAITFQKHSTRRWVGSPYREALRNCQDVHMLFKQSSTQRTTWGFHCLLTAVHTACLLSSM
jgi:hypothetical protein